MTELFTLNTDGGSRGNPGQAAIGGVIKNSAGEVIETFKEKIGIATNNTAEYKALIHGLKLATSRGIKNLKCILDSELAVRQIIGQYKVKEDSLKVLHSEIKSLESNFDEIQFTHVKRKENAMADKLVNEALDNK